MSFVYSHPFTGLANGLNTMQGGGAVGGWVELGRTTLGAASTTINVTSLPDKRYYMVLADCDRDLVATNTAMRMGNGSFDSGSNYADRYQSDGASDGTTTSQTSMFGQLVADANPNFSVGYLANRSASEKLWMNWVVHQRTAGAANAPTRREICSKHAFTSNPIDQLQFATLNSNEFQSGDEIVVLGWDPADTHTNNFWQELDSVTLGGDNDNLTSNTFTAKKYLWVQAFFNWNGTASDLRLTFNGDDAASNANYADRRSGNGAADSTGTSKDYINLNFGSASLNGFCNLFIINNSANEKLCIYHTIMTSAAGASTAPEKRTEGVAKWDTTGSQITDIDIYTEVAASTFQSGTILKVWGAD